MSTSATVSDAAALAGVPLDGVQDILGGFSLLSGGISNAAAQKRVIQNLYELAAAISSTTGMTKHELGADWLGPGFSNTMKTTFRSSAYAKVY